MVTFKQVARSYAASVRAAEREQKRHAKETAKLYKEQLKQLEILSAEKTVKNYQDYLDILVSIHKNCSNEKINWEEVLNDEEPEKPLKKQDNELIARERLEQFKPLFFAKIFGANKKKKLLEEDLKNAINKDIEEYEKSVEIYKDWEKTQSIAKGIRNYDIKAYAEAINFFEPFSDLSDMGSKLEISFNKEFIEIDLHVNDSTVIPNYVVNQTKTGKLSKKDMPKGKFNELYQDYVCGALLRVGRETLAYLPVKKVIIHALSEMLNTTNGHLELTPIVSAIIVPETVDKLNFENLDPSDSMKNFIHNMKFTKTNGFSKVEKLNIEN